jgi:superfamily II DNA or RNA helicase/HKD family nuclease
MRPRAFARDDEWAPAHAERVSGALRIPQSYSSTRGALTPGHLGERAARCVNQLEGRIPITTEQSRGLYEILITELLQQRLQKIDERSHTVTSGLRPSEAADRIALHLSRLVQRVIEEAPEKERVAFGVHLVRALATQISDLAKDDDVLSEALVEPAAVLRRITGRLPDGSPDEISEPLIPLLDTTLLTNSPGEPRVGNQVLAEIQSADRIDIVMAFIRRSGIRPLLEALGDFCRRGRPVRVLTTTYTASTELAALEDLKKLGAEVRVSYDVSTTRLHAKAWIFHRQSGFSTAYIGSSNLTHSAQISGLEWNVRVSGVRNPAVIEKVAAVFETYWNSVDFVPYDADEFAAATERLATPGTTTLSPIELRLEPFQEYLLEQIALARSLGHTRNLLVSATGTGKTVMAAVDYARLRSKLPRARLLFVAHREEILQQSLSTFRHALRDYAFGELWVGGTRPRKFENVFASIQSIRAATLKDLDPAHFDVVVVDEFHHAAAPSYQALLDTVKPLQLLGLTATPERSDGLPVVELFENRIAAELRLWDAIDQHRLCPFMYFGIHDDTDLSALPWQRGRGYDVGSLESLYTGDEVWAKHVLAQIERKVPDHRQMRALGFCVSVAHARFMSKVFNDHGVAAVAVWADSPDDERRAALSDLAARRVNVVFSVDLFNEGIDVPAVDTLLLLRPTDSPILFLQQLGRGLRRTFDKTVCTVLDFVGHHRKEFRFDRRFQALLGSTRNHLIKQIEEGFPFLPAGCHMELDRVAAEIVLRNIRESVASKWPSKVEELRLLARRVPNPTLQAFLDESGLQLEDVYANGRSWSDLKADAGLISRSSDSEEQSLLRACGRLLHVNDLTRVRFYRDLLSAPSLADLATLSVRDRRLTSMLIASVAGQVIDKGARLNEAAALVWDRPRVRDELLELLKLLETRVDHVQQSLDSHADVPLRIHARYTRLEILAAFGIGNGAKVPPWQTGVYWANDAKADLLAFTLDKTSGSFSPTTRYRDYAISPDLIHWESQSATREDSPTGLRYRNHLEMETSIMLFARLNTDDRAFWFLGPATFVKHESEQPMAVTWKLQYRLAADLFASFAAAVA